MTSFLPLILIGLPVLAAPLSFALGKRRIGLGYALTIAASALCLLLSGWLLWKRPELSLALPGALGLELSFRVDGFRALYATVASLMWLVSAMMLPQYMGHGHGQARYLLFTLLTMGATLGVFLSDDLITAFVFFEILSFTSYTWVAHEQNAPALRAGQTYLAIAVLGGMAMLMGLMMLKAQLHSLRFEELETLARGADRASLWLPGLLILAGFGAKAGMFPLHVWLPKAHPVAPAPASALLSGVLTKVGIFGILVISSRLFVAEHLWGNLLLVLGLVNMMLGALMALFSVDLKRTLACSSVSQIGFILFGIGLQNLLGEHNALAAQGTLLHMLNHSLIKLCLFLAAGVVYLRLHLLDLNAIRGIGRRRYGLMAIFLVGAASLSGIPLFGGFASKTLLHEALVEYIEHLHHLGESAMWYSVAEWAFLLTGGLTFCYMLKLFIALFVQKHPTRQAEFDRMGSSMKPLSAVALAATALLMLALGLFPEKLMAPLANLGLPFMLAHPPEHAVVFLTPVNLMGGGISLGIGLALYLTLVRGFLMGRDAEGGRLYLNRWPAWLDMEDGLYRPLVSLLKRAGMLLCWPLDKLVDTLVPHVLMPAMNALSRVLEAVVDGVAVFLMRTLFRRKAEESLSVPVGNRFTFTLGRAMDRLSFGFNRLFTPGKPWRPRFIYVLSAAWEAANETLRRMLRTLSFSLMLFAVGFVLLLTYLLTR